MTRLGNITPALTALALATVACQPANEYRAALPQEEDVTMEVPERSTSRQGLGTSRSALVGEPAEYYSMTYYQARDMNALAKFVVDLVETITEFPPSKVLENRAVWGPFSDDNEPNEFRLTVERDAPEATQFVWTIEGRHKSGGNFKQLAAGDFRPEGLDLGKGWFYLDFSAIGELDPTEETRGAIAYAFSKTKTDLSIRAKFKLEAEDGTPVRAAYAFGRDDAGNGFTVFAFPTDINEDDDDAAQKNQLENVVIRTTWIEGGVGRADLYASGGDLEGQVAQGSQCWDKTFVSRYEAISVDGEILAEDGDESACAVPLAKLPRMENLPEDSDIQERFE